MPLPYTIDPVSPFDIILAQTTNEMIANIEALADGTGLDDGAVTTLLLSSQESTDFADGLALTANAWTDFRSNQSFTVAGTGSVVAISINASVIVGGANTSTVSSRLVIDSGGTPINRVLGGTQSVTTSYANPFSGAGVVYVTGLSAGNHTVKSQIRSTAASNAAFCRALTFPDSEFYRTTIVEFKK